jgi:adenine-specific DNA-methyltransferase
MNYIGSKKKLSLFLENSIKDYTGATSLENIQSFGDYFSGTGAVSSLFNNYNVKDISINDILYFNYILSSSNLLNSEKHIDTLSEFLSSNLKEPQNEKDQFFLRNYSPIGNRMYFTEENAKLIDLYRHNIDLKYEKNTEEYIYLLATLISSVSKFSNTASTFGAYLKQFKASAKKTLKLEPLKLKNNNNFDFTNLNNKNILDLDDSFFQKEVIYLDPPYNTRNYESYYHILETLALNDKPEIHGITGLRQSVKNDIYSKKEVENFYKKLFSKCKSKYLFISYSSDGIVPLDKIKELLVQNDRIDIKIYKTEYKKFKSNKDQDNKTIEEYLISSSIK